MSPTLRRLSPLALTATVLAVVAAGPSAAAAARQTPDQVIDAKANPDAAAAALNSGCADMSNCKWNSDTKPTVLEEDYGPPALLGDVLYNCADEEYAETAVSVEDERQETTSVSEKVSLKVSLGFLGFEKTSAEMSVFSKQSESFSIAVKITDAVEVPPGYKGWTVTQPRTVAVNGSAYITSGINKLIQVKNIDLSFPFPDPDLPIDASVTYTGIKAPMTADDIKAACDPTDDSAAALLAATKAPPKHFALRVCGRSGRCASRTVAGSLPPRVRRAGARLSRAGRTVGRGTYVRGRTRLAMQRRLKPGKYRLTLTERRTAAQRTGAGRLSAVKTIVPITVS
jgi:hypothetical protein